MLRQDKTLPTRLRAEAEGILAWLVRGAVEWASGGLRPPESVLHSTREYRHNEDHIARFLDESCDFAETGRISLKELHSAYVHWSGTQEGVFPLQVKAFSGQIAKRDFKKTKSNLTQFLGLSLKSTFAADP
jgi:putative DNA primase/helicase